MRGLSFNIPVRFLIFTIAVGVRLIFVHLYAMPPVNDVLWNDAVGWNLAQGNGFTASQSEPRVPGIYRTPGYPAFLAIIYKVFGHSYDAVYISQAILDAASAVLVGLIAMQYFPSVTAVLASLLYALYPYSAIFCGSIHQDILLVFCVLLIVFQSGRAIKSDRSVPWFWIGTLVGAAALIKANMVLFLAVPSASVLFYFRSRRLQRLAILLSGMTVILIPWIVRNYIVFGSFPPLAAGATGTNLRLVVLELNKGEEAVRQVGLSPPNIDLNKLVGDGQPLIDSEKRMAAVALGELRKRWPEYSILVLRHIPRLWITTYSRWYSPTVSYAGRLLSWLVLVCGLTGMLMFRKRWRELLPLYLTVIWITLMYAPYTVEARYTLPARPIMICFIAALLGSLIQRRSEESVPQNVPV